MNLSRGVKVAIATLATACGALAQTPLTRVAATTLKMPSAGSTDAYIAAPAFGGIFFEQPVQVVFAPGDTQRAFVVERTGRIVLIRDTANPTRETFLDLTARIGTETPDHGLLSFAFHPRFAENGFVYAWYSIYVNGQRANRLARFRASSATSTEIAVATESPLITQLTGPGGHDGGTILFGADGYLYLSLGDGDQSVAEVDAAHQRIDRGFFGGVIRIDVDQRAGSLPPNPHPSFHIGTYTIPPDNPFVGATSFNGAPVLSNTVRTEFWAVGLRNPWRMAFDPADGRLWLADVGLSTREEINIVTRGSNYGWEFREGLVAGPRIGAPPAGVQFTDPIWDYPTNQGVSITGGFVYRGSRFLDLAGRYLFADFVSGRIWALADNNARPLPATQVRQLGSEVGITGITLDPRTGDVLLADFDSNMIKKLVANPNADGVPLPPTLADTGVFANVAALTPAPGVVPYAPNVSFWSDYARKTRWFALPDATSTFGFKANGPWSLPAGAVWVKHFDLELRRGVPASARRVETRILVKTQDGIYGASYRWNDAQTNATLVGEQGAFQSFEVIKPDGSATLQTWIYPSRNNCLSCHTDRGGGALTFNTRQMNRDFPGSSAHQITAMAAAGYLDVRTVAAPASLPALADPNEATWPIETRARAYLDANCAQCHQPGGTALGSFDARATTPLSLAGIVNGPIFTAGSSPADRVIVPGDAAHSILQKRMTGVGIGRMPPLGTAERDPDGEAIISQCIADLARAKSPSRLLNLAARAQVGTGIEVLIPGFVIAGGPRAVLVRAVGPTLADFGVSGALSVPELSLYDAQSRVVASNTRWTTGTNLDLVRAATSRVGAFPLGETSADAALFVTLEPGAYTAQASGANNSTGVALVEIYEDGVGARPGSIPAGGRLVNTAVRARVGTGANVLIPGLVVSEGAAKTVLIRAVGPGLVPFGVTGVLAEPIVTLFAGSESFSSNRGWNNAANVAEIRATAERVGAFKLAEGGADSAILVSLSPGAYTVQVGGANNTSGVALVEVYEVP